MSFVAPFSAIGTSTTRRPPGAARSARRRSASTGRGQVLEHVEHRERVDRALDVDALERAVHEADPGMRRRRARQRVLVHVDPDPLVLGGHLREQPAVMAADVEHAPPAAEQPALAHPRDLLAGAARRWRRTTPRPRP